MLVPSGVSAQSAAEADFLSKNRELAELFGQARKTNDYKACEDILRKQIALFCSMDSLLSEPFGYFKHKSYYDLACIQSIEGKKDEAIRSFAEAYDDGNFELTYKSVMEDKDLDNIRNEKGFQTILA